METEGLFGRCTTELRQACRSDRKRAKSDTWRRCLAQAAFLGSDPNMPWVLRFRKKNYFLCCGLKCSRFVFFGSISLENVYNHVNVNTELEIRCSVLGTPNTARKKLIKKQEKKVHWQDIILRPSPVAEPSSNVDLPKQSSPLQQLNHSRREKRVESYLRVDSWRLKKWIGLTWPMDEWLPD